MEMKFSTQVAGKAPKASYATVKESLIQTVQKGYKGGIDVAKSLKDMKKVDLSKEEPVREISRLTDPVERAIEQDGFNIRYQERLRRHYDRSDALEEGMNKCFALIYSNYCTKTMRARIEEHPNFKTHIQDNPIALLEAIRENMHETQRAKYPWESMVNHLANCLNVQQREEEPLVDYVKRVKQLLDIVESLLGTDLFSDFIGNQEVYWNETNPDTQATMKLKAYQAFSACILFCGCDKSKYGSLIQDLNTQFSLGHDQFPKTLTKATEALSNHKFDPQYYDNRQRCRNRQQQAEANNEPEPTPPGNQLCPEQLYMPRMWTGRAWCQYL